MAQTTTIEDSQEFHQRLKKHLHRTLSNNVRELIRALQERQVIQAQEIAGDLLQDLSLCDDHRLQYFLSQIISVISIEDVFDHCDELSAWLLFLEQEVERSHSVARSGLFTTFDLGAEGLSQISALD